ncbi:MAG: sulfate permease [Bacteroidetes bacterium]|nr:MAG: sulfate permease [Bacteroidota bacterium]
MFPNSYRYFPITRWLPGYSLANARRDLIAGLSVGVMLVPQGMAYAVLAGVPPVIGLYASLVPLLMYPIFGTARHLAVGIVAIDCIIVAGGLSQIATPMTEDYIALAIMLAFLVGALQMAMGLLRLGFIVNLLSRPVTLGFMSGAVIIIGVSQLPDLLGIAKPVTSSLTAVLVQTVTHVSEIHLLTTGLGILGIVIILAVRKWLPRLPAALIAVVAGATLLTVFSLDEAGVAVVAQIPSGLPAFAIPEFHLSSVRALLPTAFTLVLVQFMTLISLGSFFAAKHRYQISANTEFFTLGVMNLVGSMFRAIPVSGSFSRSAVNEHAGAASALSNVVAALVVGMALLFLTPVFAYLPMSLFASMIIVASLSLIDISEALYILRTKRVDGIIALSTFAATLLLGIHQGILFGILASAAAVVYRVSRPNIAILGHLPGSRSYRELEFFPEAKAVEGIAILRLDASFAFTNARYVRTQILIQADREDIRAIVLDASSINDLDTTALAVLIDITRTLQEREIDLYFGGMKTAVFRVIQKSELVDMLGEDRFALSPYRAVNLVLSGWGRETNDIPVESS